MKALQVTSHTLVGTSEERPSERGNCFSVMADDEKEYAIVNFNLENLQALQTLGLQWPIEIEALRGRFAVIQDGRIGERWYQLRFCEVCCPRDLLPITQRLRQKRDIARGIRSEGGGGVTYHLDRGSGAEYD